MRELDILALLIFFLANKIETGCNSEQCCHQQGEEPHDKMHRVHLNAMKLKLCTHRSDSVDAGDVDDVALGLDQVRGGQHCQVIDRPRKPLSL